MFTGTTITAAEIIKTKGVSSADCLLRAASLTLKNRGIIINERNSDNIGFFLGATFVNFVGRRENADNYLKKGVRVVNPAEFPKGLISYFAGHVSRQLNIQGAHSTLSSGISSGIDALTQAIYFIKRDKSNVALVAEFGEILKSESMRFPGEVACLVLENSSRINSRRSYGEILAIESFFEKKGQNTGLLKAAQSALKRCSLDIADIDFVFGSGASYIKEHLIPKESTHNIRQYLRKDLPYFNEKTSSEAAGLFLIGYALMRRKLFKRPEGVPKSCVAELPPKGVMANLPIEVGGHSHKKDCFRYCNNPTAAAMFLTSGENTNSSCVVVKLCRKRGV